MRANFKAVGTIAIGAVGFYALYSWFSKPGTFKPTIENINTVTIRKTNRPSELTINIDDLVSTIHKNGTTFEHVNVHHKDQCYDVHAGIAIDETDDTVCVFSRGYAKVESPNDLVNPDFYDLTQYGGGARGALIQCIDNIAPDAPVIGFDYRDDRRHFSMGAHRELECLNLVMKKVEEKNPNACIILIADCRGAGVGLRHAALQKTKNLRALVLMSPFVSGRELSDQIADNYLSYLPLRKQLLNTFFNIYYPCYHPKDHDKVHAQLKNIPSELPIFIAHRKKDTLISPLALARLRNSLEHTTKLQFLEIEDESAPHSKITHLPEVAKKYSCLLSR